MRDYPWFSAPWGKLLWFFTLLGVGIITVALLLMLLDENVPMAYRASFSALMTITLIGCALTMVRGYRLEDDTLVIERLGWEKRISLRGLTSVRHDKDLIRGAIRVGNGGLFAFSGWFWSKTLGWFHLAGNDILGRAVLLEIGPLKWMITPENPDDFVSAAQALTE